MEFIPVEIFDVIVGNNATIYNLLARAIPKFARTITDEKRIQYWAQFGYSSRDFVDRTEWYLNKKLHRMDGPAIIYNSGDKYWYQFGDIHRSDGPAVEESTGTKYWFQNGEYHRLDGPAIINSRGDEHWYQNGRRHRIGGPAKILAEGLKEWWVNGKRHRRDGPAVESGDENSFRYYINGEYYSHSQYLTYLHKLNL